MRRTRRGRPVQPCRATLPALAALAFTLLPASTALAQEGTDERPSVPPSWVFGAGVGLGWGPFATDSGPWLDAFAVAEAPLSDLFHFRVEPGLTSGWMSDSGFTYLYTDAGDYESFANDETFDAYGVMARAMLGLDFTDWATLRLGGTGGYLLGSFDSSLCPSESYSRGQYGLLAQLGVRLGSSRRLEAAVQGEALADFANPRCRPYLETPTSRQHVIETEPSRGSLGFLSARISYVWR